MLKGTLLTTLSASALTIVLCGGGVAFAADATTDATNSAPNTHKAHHKKHHRKIKQTTQTTEAAAITNAPTQTGSATLDTIKGYVHFDSDLSWQMLNHYDGVNRELSLLHDRKSGSVAKGLTLGGDIQGDVFWQGSSAPGNMRNPSVDVPANVDTASQINLTRADLSFTNAFNDWATAYASFDYFQSDTSDTTRWNKAYLVLGNLASSPFYGLIGRNDINFGQFASVNQYSLPLNRWLFQANGNVAEVGVNAHGFDLALSAMNGGKQTVAVDQTNLTMYQNLKTLSSGASEAFNVNNFAVNAGYDVDLQDDMTLHVGTGLLRGTGFSAFVSNTDQRLNANPAWDFNTAFTWENLKLIAEVTSTIYAVGGQTPSGILPPGVYSKPMTGWQAGGEYSFMACAHKLTASLDYSAITKYPAEVPVAENGTLVLNLASQYVLGLRGEIIKNVTTGFEYAYDKNAANYDLVGANANNHYNTITWDITAMF